MWPYRNYMVSEILTIFSFYSQFSDFRKKRVFLRSGNPPYTLCGPTTKKTLFYVVFPKVTSKEVWTSRADIGGFLYVVLLITCVTCVSETYRSIIY